MYFKIENQMKYTRLSLADLKDLETEFIEFLIVNGIEAKEWEELKKSDMAKVEKIVDQFSDVIWEGVLRKTKMVEHRHPNKLTVCHVEEGELLTLNIHAKNKHLDLTNQEEIDRVLADIDQHKVSVQKDKITKPAPEQLFDFIKIGFFITKNPIYKRLIDRELK